MPKIVKKKTVVNKKVDLDTEPDDRYQGAYDPKPTKTPPLSNPSKSQIEKNTRTVHRFFECLVHAEIAVDQLSKIGIYPGGEMGEVLQQKLQDAISIAKSVVADYQVICNEIGY